MMISGYILYVDIDYHILVLIVVVVVYLL